MLSFSSLPRLAVIAGVCWLAPGLRIADAQRHPVWRNNDVMYNYYAGPAQQAGGTAAQLYVSPRPTPPLVGHTYVTYQPLMPHEFLYGHHRTYSAVHPDGGWVRTNVSYGTFPLFGVKHKRPLRYRPQPVNFHLRGPHYYYKW